MFLTKRHVRNQIKLMDNGDEKKWIERLCTNGMFLFTYDGITDNNTNPNHDIKEFCQDQLVALEFSIYSINFWTKKNPNSTFRYNYCL